ncbi:MAG: rRNA pseudouridine synthase RluC [Pseudomonadota bacterium]|jgi:23S rRNA pseudouridine955/2504/2580 synthase
MNTTLDFSRVNYLEINELQAEQRIDNFLLKHLKTLPKSHLYRLLRKGEIRVNKGRIKPDYRLKQNDILRLPPLQLEQKVSSQPSSRLLDLLSNCIMYEDKELLVLNKPSGIAVHGGSGISSGVIEGLRALFPKAPFLELVHRLDRETSGCLLIAKKPAMLRQLHEDLRNHQLEKTYLALVKGRWNPLVTQINAPLQRNILHSGERMVKVETTGKEALSYFHLRQHFKEASFMEIKLATGRTHQIRVHAAFVGHGLAGDEKYGDGDFNKQMKEYGLNRLFLHAWRLRLPHYDKPFQAPLDEQLKKILTILPK